MSYWEDRAKEIIKEETLSDQEMSKEIERIVNEMIEDIEKEISAFYARYATREGISLEDAKKKIDAVDVIKFANQAKKYVDTQDFSDRVNEELRAYNTKMYVSREELLKAQIGLLVTYTYAKLESQMNNYLESAYYRALKQQAGILGDTLQVASTDVKAIVLAPFQNSNWSRRLWRDMRKTRIQVQRAVTHVIIRGRHPYEFVKELRKESGNSTYEIRRLLITETARVQTIATKQHMLENQGPDAEYKYVAKLDGKTTKTCRGLNGKVFKVKDMKPGVNAPPMHPFCRSSVVPYVGDWRKDFFEKRKGKYAFGGIVE